jgi:uncharacterized protein YjbI with pentapeptide repeats
MDRVRLTGAMDSSLTTDRMSIHHKSGFSGKCSQLASHLLHTRMTACDVERSLISTSTLKHSIISDSNLHSSHVEDSVVQDVVGYGAEFYGCDVSGGFYSCFKGRRSYLKNCYVGNDNLAKVYVCDVMAEGITFLPGDYTQTTLPTAHKVEECPYTITLYNTFGHRQMMSVGCTTKTMEEWEQGMWGYARMWGIRPNAVEEILALMLAHRARTPKPTIDREEKKWS